MKKILFINLLFVVIVGLTGCNKEKKDLKLDYNKPKEATENTKRDEVMSDSQNFMQESLKIQVDDSMSKEEKAAALEDIQRRNKERLKKEMKK